MHFQHRYFMACGMMRTGVGTAVAFVASGVCTVSARSVDPSSIVEIQIFRDSAGYVRALAKEPDAAIAMVAEDSAHLARHVIVVNVYTTLAVVEWPGAYATQALLLAQQDAERLRGETIFLVSFVAAD